MHKYEVIIYWSNEDGVFVAEAPELPGCTAHGDTQEAALEHIGQAIDLWLETAREFGDQIPETEGRTSDAGMISFSDRKTSLSIQELP